jgi:hypothetical protein
VAELKSAATDGGESQFTELKKLCTNLSLLQNQDTKYQTKLQNIEVKLKDMKQQKQQKSKIQTKIKAMQLVKEKVIAEIDQVKS